MDHIFVPVATAHAVTLIETRLGLPGTAVMVPFEPMPNTRESHCFENVRDMVRIHGGQIFYGWAVWQHGHFFVEAEYHGVWQKPSGQLVCVTPQTPREKALTFIPDPSAVYDFDSRLYTKNVRIALIRDSRLEEAFRLLDQQVDLRNACRRRNPNDPGLSEKEMSEYFVLELRKASLMTQVMSDGSSASSHESIRKVGRNDPCSCMSGKKFKKCHGA